MAGGNGEVHIPGTSPGKDTVKQAHELTYLPYQE